jgi:hypothetical protein
VTPRVQLLAAIVFGWLAVASPGTAAASSGEVVEAARALPARVAPLQDRVPGHFWLIALAGVLVALRTLRVNR